jgi:O-antigen/teichoic acid export membrane protein
VLIGLGILLSVIVFVDVLKELFISDESYWEAMPVVPYILLANLCLGIYFNLSVWYKITDRTKFGAYFSVVGALVTLALNFWLIPIIGYKGSAIATLSAYGTMMILSWYFGKKHYPIPYNLKKLGIFTVLALGFSALSFLLFRGNLVIGVLLIAVFFGALYVSEHKELKQFLK